MAYMYADRVLYVFTSTDRIEKEHKELYKGNINVPGDPATARRTEIG